MDSPSEENRPDRLNNEFDALSARLDRLWSEQNLAGPKKRVSNYEIRNVLGSGAFGIVYLAVDTRTNQPVALKLPRPEVLLEADRLERFEAEAQVASSLEHPAIVRIYSANLSSATPFIASQYVAGPNLEEWLCNQSEIVSPAHAVEFLLTLADAVEYAHQHGIVHRDLKPSNVLLSEKDELDHEPIELGDFEPHLTDFGLAKCLDYKLTDTRSSLMLGTPLYMAPEQFMSDSQAADNTAADIYSLGVLLFEILTLRTPHAGESYVEIADQIRNRQAPRLRELRPEVPADLEKICSKCLEKEPADRYATALELSEDLRRFQAGQSVKAKPVSRHSQIWRRIRRHPWVASLTLLAALSTLAAVSFMKDASSYQRQAAQSLATADEAIGELNEIAYADDMTEAFQRYEKLDVNGVQEILEKYASSDNGLRNFAFDALTHLMLYPEPLVLRGHEGHVGEVATRPGHPDELVSVGEDGTIRRWNWKSGELLDTIKVSPRGLYGLAVSPDGSTAATGNMILSSWNLETKKQLKIHAYHETTIEEVAYSPNGKLLASSARNRSIQITSANIDGTWRSEDYRTIESNVGQESLIFLDDKTIVSIARVGASGRIKRWSTSGEEQKQYPSVSSTSDYCTAISHNRQYYASAGTSNMTVRNFSDDKEVWRSPIFPERTCDLQFSPDDAWLACGGRDGVLRLLRIPSLDENKKITPQDPRSGFFCVPAHEGRITSVCFPSADHVATAGLDGTIKVWNLVESPSIVLPHSKKLKRVSVTHDGTRTVSVTKDNYVELRSLPEQELIWRAKISTADSIGKGAQPPVSSPDSRYCATFAKDDDHRVIRVWALSSGELEHQVELPDKVWALAFSPDSKWIAATGSYGTTSVWDLQDQANVFNTRMDSIGDDIVFSQDSQYMAVCQGDAGALLFKTDTWKVETRFAPGIETRRIALCPTRPEMATTHSDGSIRFWDIVSGEVTSEIRGLVTRLPYLAYHPDGTLLATSNVRDGVVLWDLRTKRRLGTVLENPNRGSVALLKFADNGVLFADFVSDGVMLHVGSAGRSND